MKVSTRANLIPAACIAVVAIAYLPSLATKFVADDWTFLIHRPTIDFFRYFYTSIIPPEWDSLWLRPIPMLFFWLDTRLWPGTTWGPHLINLAFHCTSVWLVWRYIRTAFSGSEQSTGDGWTVGGIFACLLFGLHPLAVGAVGWVAARFDVMSLTFGLAGLIVWLRRLTGTSGKGLTAGLVLLILSVLSKEQGTTFLAACFIMSLVTVLKPDKAIKSDFRGLAVLVITGVIYIAYRLTIFQGLGGYLTVSRELSISTPLSYLAALLYPFHNPPTRWVFSWTVPISAALCLGVFITLFRRFRRGQAVQTENSPLPLIGAAALFLFGLTTTAPHHVLTFEAVLDHAESRFALIPLAGGLLCAGILADRYLKTAVARRIISVALFVWCAGACWRTDVQIQAWKQAGETAHSIIEQTLSLVPVPPRDSTMLLFEIPRETPQFVYVFGIGLKEALFMRYGRSDFDVKRYPTNVDVRSARPGFDSLLRYETSTGKLDLLRPRRSRSGQQSNQKPGQPSSGPRRQ